MPDNPQTNAAWFETLRRLFVFGATLAVLAVILFSVLTLLVTVPGLARAADDAALRLAAAWAPVPIYLWAIWEARTLFARLSPDQEQAYRLLSNGLIRIGLALSVAAILSGVFSVYLVVSLKTGGNARFISGAVPQLALCLIGLALAAVGVLLQRFGAVIAENKRHKAALEEFI